MIKNKEAAQRERDIFSANFKRILELRGKTQSDVATDLEITSSTVSDWANGKKYPRVDKMQVLADYLGVVISDLREKKEEAPLDPISPESTKKLLAQGEEPMSDTGKIIIEFAKTASEEQKRVVADLIRMLNQK